MCISRKEYAFIVHSDSSVIKRFIQYSFRSAQTVHLHTFLLIKNKVISKLVPIKTLVGHWSLPYFSEYSEDTIWGKVSGCCLVLPSLGARRAHSCHSHPWSWWRHELQTSGLSGTRPGFMWLRLSSFHMQRFEPGLQSEGLPCRMGKHDDSVRQYQAFLYPCDWMFVFVNQWDSVLSCFLLPGLPEITRELKHKAHICWR